MSEGNRLKNIGLGKAEWQQLKMLCTENEWTMTQAVAHLLTLLKGGENGRNERAQGTAKDRKEKRGQSGGADRAGTD